MSTDSNFNHKSVLLREAVDGLCVKGNGIYVDCTAGGGGHSAEIASRLGSSGTLISVDRDVDALRACMERSKDSKVIAGADAYVKIPMYGFTESFNISVCAALSLFSLTERMRRDQSLQWQLPDDDLLDLKLHWAMQAIRDGEKVVQNIMQNM